MGKDGLGTRSFGLDETFAKLHPRVTSRAEGIQIEERSMTLEMCIAINKEGAESSVGAGK